MTVYFPSKARSITAAALMAAVLGFVPGASIAQERLPDLEGTTYGEMLNELDAEKARVAGGDRSNAELRATISHLIDQNQTMIRMIDAIHDKVNGLIAAGEGREAQARQMVTSGQDKFTQINHHRAQP